MSLFNFKYSNFLIELGVIFIGITLSFWVENFREDREEKQIEIKYLKGFLSDLKRDKNALMHLRSVRLDQERSSGQMLKYFAGEEMNVDSFYHHYYTVLPPRTFIPNTNTLEEIINSSHLRILSNDSIKTDLLDLRALYGQIRRQEENVAHVQFTFLYDIGFGIVDLNGFTVFDNGGDFHSNPKFKEDALKLLQNRFQMNAYWLMESNLNGLTVLLYDPAIKECDHLIDEINEQLKSE